MWELIKQNQRKSVILFTALAVILAGLGFLIGAVVLADISGGFLGLLIALLIWAGLSFLTFQAGDTFLLFSSNARQISENLHPQIFNIVDEMRIAANLSVMPRIFIIDDPCANAFTTGRDLKNCTIVVTAGLVSKLNRDELQGVIAHEMSHILHRDVFYVSCAGVMLGSVVILAQMFLRSIWFSRSSGKRFKAGQGAGGQAQLILFVIAIVAAILAPLLARIFYFSISRKREYLADAQAARLTRYPQGLASALEKISSSPARLEQANSITAPMYIVNPLIKGFADTDLFSTHPATGERIAILKAMSGVSNISEYGKAFEKINNKKAEFMPASFQINSENIPIRTGASDQRPLGHDSLHSLQDLMRAANNFIFLTCVCGLRIKVPPDFKQRSIACPRCLKSHELPLDLKQAAAAVAAVTTTCGGLQSEKKEGLEILRTGKGWETFNCGCGHILNISPIFMGSHVRCNVCGRTIRVRTN